MGDGSGSHGHGCASRGKGKKLWTRCRPRAGVAGPCGGRAGRRDANPRPIRPARPAAVAVAGIDNRPDPAYARVRAFYVGHPWAVLPASARQRKGGDSRRPLKSDVRSQGADARLTRLRPCCLRLRRRLARPLQPCRQGQGQNRRQAGSPAWQGGARPLPRSSRS